jgi:hypothetical protein
LFSYFKCDIKFNKVTFAITETKILLRYFLGRIANTFVGNPNEMELINKKNIIEG